MKILFYRPQTQDETTRKADRVIGSLVPRARIETLESFESLRARLRRRIGDLSVVILLAPTTDDFKLLVSLGDLLEDTRSIFILPDHEPHTVAEALKLRPRFLTFADGDLEDLAEVTAKMLRNLESKRSSVLES